MIGQYMKKITDELRRDHVIIATALSEAKFFGISSKEGNMQIQKAKKKLYRHLEDEEKKIYPTLNKAAEKDTRIAKIMAQETAEIGELIQEAEDFFEKFEAGEIDSDHHEELDKFIHSFMERTKKEESTTYPEYEKLAI